MSDHQRGPGQRKTIAAWKQKSWSRWAVGFLVGYAIVTVIALAREAFIENVLGLEDQPHWISTMPLLALGLAWYLQRTWRQELASQDVVDAK